jgi:HAE1 family hydrophobic/amphiphilic exporter-1
MGMSWRTSATSRQRHGRRAQGHARRRRRQRFTIYANDQLLQGRAWNDVIVAYRNGAPVRVRDIGQAVDGPENTKQPPAWANGKRGVMLVIFKQPGANVIDTVDASRRAAALQASIPPAIKVDT